MNSIKLFVISIVFLAGTALGWGLKTVFFTQSSTATSGVPTAYLSPSNEQPAGAQTTALEAPASQSTISVTPLTQTNNDAPITSSNSVSTNNVTSWIDTNERSSYRQQVQALLFIDNASQGELEEIVSNIEHNNQRFYQRAWLYRAALQRWSELNPNAVLLHLDQLIESGNLNNIDRQIEAVRALAATDYDTASQWLSSLDPDQKHYQLIAEQINSVLAESDPQAALTRVLDSSANERSQQQAIEQIIMQWANQQPLAAIEWIEQNPDLVKNSHVKEMAVMNLMVQDPHAGLAMIPTIGNAQQRMQMEAEYASQLASSSPVQAYEWANNLTSNASRRNAQQRVLETWSYSDPESAIDFISSLPQGEFNNDVLYNIYSSAAYNKSIADPLGAMSWADTLPEPFQQAARQTAFHSWVEQSPLEAMQWAQYSADPMQRESFMQSVAPMISHTDLELAMRLYPDMSSDTQTQMAYGIVQQLYSTDPTSAENWIGTLAQGPASIEAQTMLIMMLADQHPERALNMAAQQSGEQRSQLLMQLAYSVAQMQPTVLENWIANADITEQERQMMSEVPGQMRQEGMPYYNGMPPPGMMDFHDVQLEY